MYKRLTNKIQERLEASILSKQCLKYFVINYFKRNLKLIKKLWQFCCKNFLILELTMILINLEYWNYLIGKKLQAIMHNWFWLNVKCSKETKCGYNFSWGNTWELSVLWTLNTLWWHLKYSYPETSVRLSYLLKNSLGICSSRFINFGKSENRTRMKRYCQRL